ncbi:SPX domain-containing membrane protein [Artemisia annua]|uniref:SPX domain-containing membrane protein n=1 Tax=Artemisia annua TaxID=35608 RepID=A0A2U1MCZ5_ARTAN|nr:SPX domain-containing membrane protein [Artemisia annua]
MVAFGKKLKDPQIQEWKGYYINYKLTKKKVKQYSRQIEAGGLERRYVLKDFSRMLDNKIEKVVLFMLEQQGLLAGRLDALGKEQEALQEEPDFAKISALREAYRDVGRDLLKLLFFVEINAVGLRKILKKFDKSFGYRFTDYYVKTQANHPYSQLQQVFKVLGQWLEPYHAILQNLRIVKTQGSYLSIYDQPAVPLQNPVIDTIRAAVDRLSYSTNFLTFLGQNVLIMQEELPTPSEEPIDEQRYHFMSLLLNLANTFLYMSLGAAATVCGIVIGAMAVAQIFSSVYFSAWSNRSYFRPLIFSSIVLFLGNVMYAMAYDFNSIAVLLLGRLLCGSSVSTKVQEAADKSIILDMFQFALDEPPPVYILLISKDKDYGHALTALSHMSYTVLVALEDNVSPLVPKTYQYYTVCSWNNLATGHGFMRHNSFYPILINLKQPPVKTPYQRGTNFVIAAF